MRIGILGSGQLAQLLAHSAYSLGLSTLCFSEERDAPAARFSPLFIGKWHDYNALRTFAEQCDVVTLENENIDRNTVTFLTEYVTLHPGIEAICTAQDRLFEKNLFQALNIPTAPFFEIGTLDDLQQALHRISLPAVLKTRRFGYDGKGQVIIHNIQQAQDAWEAIGQVPALLEGYIDFDYEVSLIAARNSAGKTIYYPLNKNVHCDGILRFTESPHHHPALQQIAEEFTAKLLQRLNYVGVLAFEFFVKDNTLIANEIAPRVHNSGHATIEGFNVSQFENHLRCITNLPLLQPVLHSPTIMCNIIGRFPVFSKQDYQRIRVYDYGKKPRPGRKLGHVTVILG